jgi:hypothetical protein
MKNIRELDVGIHSVKNNGNINNNNDNNNKTKTNITIILFYYTDLLFLLL